MTQNFVAQTSEHLRPSSPLRGYIEGYYGRLFTFQERIELLETLSILGCKNYLYAPKEDVCHRFKWRKPYDADWRAEFSQFCAEAKDKQIFIWAGIAPGLDFDFAEPSTDTQHLCAKAHQVLDAGADGLVVMFDDISDDVSQFARLGLNEGASHGALASMLRERFDVPILLVPRLYADEIEGDVSAYAKGLEDNLHQDIGVLICGEQIVAKQVNSPDRMGMLGQIISHQKVIWDNYYCNDYCPRRLFLAEYQGRKYDEPVLLNGTGMLHTDKLLLALFTGRDRVQSFKDAGVPDAFWLLAPFFDKPVFTHDNPAEIVMPPSDVETWLGAIEEMLWSWKSPLAREWYPYLFGLKQDILIQTGQMEDIRIAKTQNLALFKMLKGNR